jgi:hypothetical protein
VAIFILPLFIKTLRIVITTPLMNKNNTGIKTIAVMLPNTIPGVALAIA